MLHDSTKHTCDKPVVHELLHLMHHIRDEGGIQVSSAYINGMAVGLALALTMPTKTHSLAALLEYMVTGSDQAVLFEFMDSTSFRHLVCDLNAVIPCELYAN